MPYTIVENPAGVYGLTANFHRLSFQALNGEASTAMSSGELVSFMTTSSATDGQVLRATTTVAGNLLGGFVMQEDLGTVPAGVMGQYCFKGLIANAIADYATSAASDLLTIPSTTTGRTNKFTIATTSLGTGIGVVIRGVAGASGVTIPLTYVNKF